MSCPRARRADMVRERSLVEDDSLFTVADVALHLLDGDLGLDLINVTTAAHVDAHDVTRDTLVAAPFVLVAYDEDHVEAREDGRLEVDVLTRRLEVVVPTEDRIGGGKHRGAGIEDGGDAGLGDGDGLLLHGLVDRDPILVAHLVELVDAHDPTVGQHHRPALEVELACRVVPLDRGRQTRRGRALA